MLLVIEDIGQEPVEINRALGDLLVVYYYYHLAVAREKN
jgi:hypothetical protein